MALCQFGSEPKSTSPTDYWITRQDLQAWLGEDRADALTPWLASMAEELVQVSSLCATEPPQPDPISKLDLYIAQSNPLSMWLFGDTLRKFAKWNAWSQLCQCKGASVQCGDFTVPATFPGDWALIPGAGFVWPGAWWDNRIPANLYHYDSNCPPVAWQVQQGPCLANDGPGWSQIFPDGTIVSHGAWSSGPGYTALDDMSVSAASHGAQFGIILLCYLYGGAGTYPIDFRVTGGPPIHLPPTPAPGPPPITVVFPPPPPRNCTSVNDLCNVIINWFSFQNSVNPALNFNTAPTSYVPSITTRISGQGDLGVASGTLGLAVQVIENPPALDPRPSDPAEYWNLGWIRTGSGDTWDRKAWIRTNGQRIFPTWRTMDRYAWTLADGVVLDVTELVAPPFIVA